jgi:hypothetical protein
MVPARSSTRGLDTIEHRSAGDEDGASAEEVVAVYAGIRNAKRASVGAPQGQEDIGNRSPVSLQSTCSAASPSPSGL